MADWAVSDRREFLFWRNIDRSQPDGCWPWRGIPGDKGYGHATVAGWKTTAHRAAYALANGRQKVADGLVVRHTCDNPICCNPDHLIIGTQAQNLADMRMRGRAGDCRSFGEQHGRCKLSDEQVAEVRQLRQAGWSQQRIADNFGMGQSQISRIVRGQHRRFQAGQYPVDRSKLRSTYDQETQGAHGRR